MLMHYFYRLRARLIEHIDPPLLVITLLLMIAGLATVYSATYDSNNRAYNQLLNMAVGLVVMWGVAQVPPQKLMRFAVPLYIIGVILLILVFVAGIKVNGAKRWLSLGFIRIQPSEILKIAMPLMLAWYFQKYEAALKLRHYAIAGLLLIIPFALIAKQPDLGTAILVGAAGFYVIFFAGLPWKIIAGMVITAASAAPFVWTMLHDYQRKRILTLIDPTTDPLGSGYHIIQSKIALGSGGVWGKGFLQGTQSHLDFLPERQTDFIFTMFAEEWGLVGGVVLLSLYSMLVLYGVVIALRCRSQFGKMMAFGLSFNLFTYFFINTAMVMGLIPVVGVPLPLISYGGTAMMTVLAGFGLMMSAYVHRDVKIGRTGREEN